MRQPPRHVTAHPNEWTTAVYAMRGRRSFEVSVDTRTKGRRLDGYTKRSIDGHELLLDPDLLKLPIELTR